MTWNSYLNRLTQIRRRLEIESLEQKQLLTAVFLLDFDGHNDGTRDIPAYTGSAEWQDEIVQMVAEDFRPFDVDVTDIDDGTQPDVRVVLSGRQMPGVDYSFDGADGSIIVYAGYVGGYPLYIGNITSHLLGEHFGLEDDGAEAHDGFPAIEGYPGHGVPGWGPIMGYSLAQPLTQWSDGNYPFATNEEDDIAILGAQLGFREDDYGDSTFDATPIFGSATGVIGTSQDVDVFSFEVKKPGVVQIDVRGVSHTNLDAAWALYGKHGLVAIESPDDSLDAVASVFLKRGTYTLHVDGVGKPMKVYEHGIDWGYDGYGSLGQYTVDVSGQNLSLVSAALEGKKLRQL